MKFTKALDSVKQIHGEETAQKTRDILPYVSEIALTSIESKARVSVAPVIMDILSTILNDAYTNEGKQQFDMKYQKAHDLFGAEVAADALNVAVSVGEEIQSYMNEKGEGELMLPVVGALTFAVFDYFFINSKKQTFVFSKNSFMEFLQDELSQ